MAKPFPLQTLLDLARIDSERAAARLGVLNGHDREMEQRLLLLLEYRNEYRANLEKISRTGMSSIDWRNFREFIHKIDAAVVQQRQAVTSAKQELQAGQDHWHAQKRKLKSFDTLCTRHHSAELRFESRREQKEQDEFALKGFLGERMAMG